MEKLIILALLVIGSAISSYFQNKKKREDEDQGSLLPRKPSGAPPVPHWPKTTQDWQQELRRILQGKLEAPPPAPPQISPPPKASPAPPIVRTKTLSGEGRLAPLQTHPLKESEAAYERAARLQGRVESRLQAVDALTQGAKPAAHLRPKRPAASVIVKRWTRNRQSLREAFIASLIFSPPAGLRGE